ncbi:hypothetical protein FGIG_07822, partial [Fasciola gigantica]
KIKHLTDAVSYLHQSQTSRLRVLDKWLQAPENRAIVGSSDYVFPLANMDQLKDLDKNIFRIETQSSLDAILRSSVDQNVRRYIQLKMPCIMKKTLILEVNYSGAHCKYAFEKNLCATSLLV